MEDVGGSILTPAMGTAINLADLGRRIRAARLARRLTLEEAVARTDFTVSWLSKIENGLLAPSLEGLVRLAAVLECGVDSLVAGLVAAPRYVVDRAHEGPRTAGRDGRQGAAVEQLAAAWRQRSMEPTILHLAGSGGRKTTEHFEGERFLHVIAGDVNVCYGDEAIGLSAGDSIYLDASIPHWVAPAGRSPARVLSVRFEPNRNHGADGEGRPSRPRAGGNGRRDGSLPAGRQAGGSRGPAAVG